MLDRNSPTKTNDDNLSTKDYDGSGTIPATTGTGSEAPSIVDLLRNIGH